MLDITAAHRRKDGAEIVVWSGVPSVSVSRGVATPKVLWRESPLDPPTPHIADPLVADLDEDGETEVYTVGFEGATLSARAGRSGALRWREVDAVADGQLYAMRDALAVINDRELSVHDSISGAPRWRAHLDDVPGLDPRYRITGVLRPYPSSDAPIFGLVLNAEKSELKRETPATRLLRLDFDERRVRPLATLDRGTQHACQALGDADILCQERSSELTPPPRNVCIVDASGGLRRCLETRGHATLLRLNGPSLETLIVVIGEERLTLREIEHGEVLRSVPLESPAASIPSPFDWNADGRDDITLSLRDGTVVAYSRDGARLGSMWSDERLGRVRPVGDLDGDGFSELTTWGNASALLNAPNTAWERRSMDAIWATPVVRDFDGDEALEVAVFLNLDRHDRLYLLDARTGEIDRRAELPTRAVLDTPLIVPRSDGTHDIITMTDDGVRRYRGDDPRHPIERYKEELTGYTTPVLYGREGHQQLIASSRTGPGLWLVDPATIASQPASRMIGSAGRLRVADLDQDGSDELLIATNAGVEKRTLPGLDPINSRTLKSAATRTPLEIVDLDGDGTLELLVTRREPAAVLALNATLGDRWKTPPELDPSFALAIPDPEERSCALVIISTDTHGLVALDADGRVRWRFPREPLADPMGFRQNTVYEDIYGDGARVLLASSSAGALYILEPTAGEVLARYRGGGDEPTAAAPAVADLDDDGRREILFVGADRTLRALHVAPRGARFHPRNRFSE